MRGKFAAFDETARSQGMLVSSRSWKMRINRLSTENYRNEHSPVNTLIFASETHRTLTSGTVR